MSSIGIADKYTLDLINGKIGTNQDGWAAQTMFAFLRNINSYVTGSYSRGSIKKVQSGYASAAGSITISAVANLNKTFITTVGVGSYGHVAAYGKLLFHKVDTTDLYTLYYHQENATYSTVVKYIPNCGEANRYNSEEYFDIQNTDTDTNLVAAQYGGILVSETLLQVTGPCIWQVIEFY